MGGNWKLNPVTLSEATNLASDLVRLTKNTKGVDIAVFPPYPFIAPVAEKLRGSHVQVREML
jgi:triosephosphate isomerase